MGIAVLGPLQVDGQVNGLSPRDRVVLSALVVRAGDPISTEALADALWGEHLPTSWAKVVQGCVVRLRKRLGVAAIESGSAGYRLTLSDDELDHRLFERLVERGREAGAGGDPARSSFLLQEALDLWRGRALADLDEWAPGRVAAGRLEGMRMDAEELHVEAEIGAGHAQAVVEPARTLVAQAPFRERRWVLLATALHQAGRQAEALSAVQQARARLVDELGLDPGPELAQLEQLLLRQDPSLTAPMGRDASVICPYRGLLPYGADDADSFFGRGDDVAACLRRLRDSGVLTVIGPSGVGKSSLVRAGVVASLVRGGTPVLVTTPGVHPMESLHGLKARGRQTLVVDQAEEAVTSCSDPSEQAQYFGALTAHVGAGGALVLSLRADHLGHLAPYPDIARVVEDGLYLLGPMNEPDLRDAIEGPARRAGLRLEPGLVDLLVRDVEGEPAALPMLSHVLRETWERREGPTLTVGGYRATGGIRYAVSQSAESLYDSMDDDQRGRLRGLLLRLVMPTEDGDPVRARVPRAKVAVDEAHVRLVEQLVDARLVSIDGDTVQIAHEALVRIWPRLRGWLDDDVDGQRVFRHLAGAAEAWDSMRRPESELYRGARLSRTLEWRDRANPVLNDTESAFVAASVALSETELHAAETRIAHERKVNRRLRSAMAGIALLLALALVAGFAAVRTADQAGRDRDRAEQAASIADARRVSAQALTHESAAASLLLGMEAIKVDHSPQAWENLALTLTRIGSLTRIQDTGDFIVSLAASGDGAVVAASQPIEGVQLFDARSMQPIPFDDATATSAVTFSPSGRLMAAAVNQWTPQGPPRIDSQPVRLYDMPGGELSDRQLGGWPEGANVEYTLGFSRDGRRLVAGVQRLVRGAWATGAVMVWDLARPEKPVFTVALPELALAALSPDGRRLFTATTGEHSVRAYDVDSGRLLRWTGPGLGTPPGLKGAADLSPDGSTFAIAAGNRIRRLDTSTLKARGPALQGHTGEVTDLEFSHDGSMLLSASADRSAIVWDAVSGARLRRFDGQGDQSWGATFSADDRAVYTSSGEGTLMTWDVSGRSDLLSVGADVVDDTNGTSLAAPDGRTIARMAAGRLWFTDHLTGGSVPSARNLQLDSFAWSPDGRRFVSAGLGELSLWDSKTGALLARHSYPPYSAAEFAFSPDGDKLYVDDGHGAVELLDSSSMEPAGGAATLSGDIMLLFAHPRDGTVLALKNDGSIRRVDPDTGRIVDSSPPFLLSTEDFVAAISPDGARMAVANPEGQLQLLDVDTFQWVGEPSRTEWGFNAVYAPDGSQFASVQPDRIRLWDGRTGTYQASFPLNDLPGSGLLGAANLGPGISITYLPDSSGLLVASADGRSWTVDTRTSAWVRRACKIAGRNLTRAEWKQFFPNRPYHVTCKQWPAGR
jgi:WD40 repeat protein/DNA-binding SARP family transcriptional activator